MGTKFALFQGHSDCIYALEPGPNPGDFFSSGSDGQVVLWNVFKPDQGKLIAKTQGTVYSLCFLKELNKLFISVNNDGIHLVNLESGREEWMHPTPGQSWFRMQRCEDKVIISGSRGTLIYIHLGSFEIRNIKIGNSDFRALSIQNGGKRIALGNSNGDIHILNSDFDWQYSENLAHSKTVFGLNFYPHTNQLISVGRDARMSLWEFSSDSTLNKIISIPAHLFGIHDVAVHPTKPLIATASMDKTIKIWDAETLKLLRVLDKSRHAGHGHSINQLLWLEEQELLLSCSDDRTISAWNIFE